jgi:hypothetical protein
LARLSPCILIGDSDSTIKVWDIRSSETPEVTVVNANDGWLVGDASSRFDASTLESISGCSWISADDPFHPLAPEIFMRDYYEPRLLPRLLACHEVEASGVDPEACKKAFKAVRPLASLTGSSLM